MIEPLQDIGWHSQPHARFAKGSTVDLDVRSMERRPARLAVAIIALLTISLLGPSPVLQVDSSNENRETVKNSSCVVCINELMPNADGSDQGIFPQGEWVELLNTGLAL